ncbi:MAG: MtrB/PioB family outer membrane beta-barrel protein, partial [Gammaproteobacteria bacterium]
MSKTYLPLMYLAGLCAAGGVYADDEESMDFSLDAGPVAVKQEAAKPIYTNEIELGGQYLDEDSFKFGQFSGLQNRGGYVIGNINLQQRADHNSNETDYWRLEGTNLGLSSRYIRGEYGQQGTGNIFFEYNQTPHYRWDDAQTPFIINDNTLTLPSDWVPATSTAGMTNLNASLHPVNIATERKKFRTGVGWHLAPEWNVNVGYFHEKKDGFDITSGIFGTTGGNPLGAILPRPINYDTDDVKMELSYGGKDTQVSLRYHFSMFNNTDSLTWQNPFAQTNTLL